MVVVAFLLSILGPPASANHAVWVVDEDGTATLLDCDAPNAADSDTIQGGVDLAHDGDTVKVCPGTYTETVTIHESITLAGAKVGRDARTRGTSNETVIRHPGGPFNVEADDVAIDGFTITGATGQWSAGIFTSPSFAGYEIRSNIIRNNAAGIYLNSSGNAPTLVRHNLFKQNDAAGTLSGSGIYSDLGLHFATIEENEFTGDPGSAVELAGGFKRENTSQSEVVISDNVLVDEGPVTLYNTTFASVIGNVFRQSPEAGLLIGGGVRSLDVLANDFVGGWRGIDLPQLCRLLPDGSTVCFEPDINADVVIRFNAFVGIINWAVLIIEGRHQGIVDARFNWWGDSTGPSQWSTGFGAFMWANANFFPWSIDGSFEKSARCSNQFTRRADVIRGTRADEILCGGAGKDQIRGGGGRDLLIGGPGDDLLEGQRGKDALLGGDGNDILIGGREFDSLQGWGGTDSCAEGAEGGQKATCEL